MAARTARTADFTWQAHGAGRFALAGTLGFGTAAAVFQRSQGAFEAAPQQIEVDLAGVKQADSAGLALLIEWLSWAERTGRQVSFRNIPEQIRAIARISEVETLIDPGAGSPGDGGAPHNV